MNHHMQVLTVPSLPADIEIQAENCVDREVRGYFYRRGECEHSFHKKASKSRGGYVIRIDEGDACNIRPGRWELRVQTSSTDIVACYELKFGTRLKVCGAKVTINCGVCC